MIGSRKEKRGYYSLEVRKEEDCKCHTHEKGSKKHAVEFVCAIISQKRGKEIYRSLGSNVNILRYLNGGRAGV